MPYFTEEQLNEIATAFGLKREETLPVRDGVVTKNTMVWWRAEHGPQRVTAGKDWQNILEYPDLYQLKEPSTRITYLD